MKMLTAICLSVWIQTGGGLNLPVLADAAAPSVPERAPKTAANKNEAEPATKTASSLSPHHHYHLGSEASEAGGDGSEMQPAVKFIKGSTIEAANHAKIKCTDPHACCEESAKIIGIVQQMYKAYSERDLDTLGKYLDPNCTTFDQGTKQLIVGREAVLAEIRNWLNKNASDEKSPLLSYTIEHPYCEVNGNDAVVTFTARKEVGGEHPKKFQSRCMDIFKKENGSWLRTHYRSNWKEIDE
jgi:ketosteroid isomerase-like protein